MSQYEVKIGRAYDSAAHADGARVLVDRISVWPRGLTKERADLDEWCKVVAPSTQLRKWFHHDHTMTRPGSRSSLAGTGWS